MMQVRSIFILMMLLLNLAPRAQVSITPLHPISTLQQQSYWSHAKVSKPTAFLPVIESIDLVDSLSDADTENWQRKDYESWLLRKLRNEHLFQIRSKDFALNGDAAANLEGSLQLDAAGRRMYTNTRGFNFTGSLGKRVFLNTSFYETQSIFPVYMDSVVSKRGFDNSADPERGSIPGFGRWKPFNTSSSYDYDYQLATGTFGIKLKENSFLQFGHDKQFVGYGYRSIFLADASSPYPFLRGQYSFWDNKITYTTTYAVLQSLERVPEQQGNREHMFYRAGARFSYLHFQPNHIFGIGFFDGNTWNWKNNGSAASWQYYSPVFAFADTNIRVRISGFNFFVRPLGFLNIYGQLATTATNGAGASSQIGIKLLEPIAGLFFTAEYNRVATGFYEKNTSSTESLISSAEPFETQQALDYYQHNDQMLGHPMGVGVNEIVFRGTYRIRDVFVNLNYQFGRQTTSTETIRNFAFLNYEVGYTFNTRSNAQIVFGNITRTETGPLGALSDAYTYFAIRTNFFNRYLDF